MSVHASAVNSRSHRPAWYKDVAVYQQPDLRRAIWQLVNSFVPYIALWMLMVRTVQLGLSYWITLALAVLAAGFLVRIFIIFHDCGHGSFFASRRANTIAGIITGLCTFTPYEYWRYNHGVHHATVGDLDRRGTGDVYLMTVEEYLAAPPLARIGYRLYEHPLIMFGLGPLYMFLISHRFHRKRAKPQHRQSVYLTTLAMAVIIALASLTIGFRTYVLVQLTTLLIAGVAGIWLFYVQHHFEGVYWARHDLWDPWRAALEGSSYYKLPKLLQWFSGNIGLHHIHHVRPRIPNYNLQRCYDEVPAMQAVKPLTFLNSLKALRFSLYDEERKELVGFRALRERSRRAGGTA
jgi:omega-6 fatty acid desaturase (delta-12 desaturase)